jgi:hypothetical protein
MSSASSSSPFKLRVLSGVDEVPVWGKFCGERGFGHRAGLRDRFTTRFLADPTASPSRVIVAADQGSDCIVGSVRLVEREVGLEGGASARVVGYADVCSDPDLRGRGIVGILLTEAGARSAFLAGEWGVGGKYASLLHAATGVAGLYEKFGFTRSRLRVPCCNLTLTRASETLPAGFAVRSADYQRDASALEEMRAGMLRRVRAVGGVVRSLAYWQTWVPATTRSGGVVLTRSDGRIVAYAAVVCRENVLRVFDWAYGGDEAAKDSQLLQSFLVAACLAAPGREADHDSVFKLAMPLLLAQDALEKNGDSAALEEDTAVSDDGWMGRCLGGEHPANAEVLSALQAAAAEGRFLVLAADGF